MEKKPTHEEWEQRIKELEKEGIQLRLEKNELTDLKDRLKILFEVAPDGYFLCDLTGRFIDVNKAAELLSGYYREELIGKNFFQEQLLPPIQLKKAALLFAEIVKGHANGPEEFTLNRKDGGQVELELRAFSVKINGETRVLAIARDITKHKCAEKVLKDHDEELTAIYDNAPFIILLVDENWTIRKTNVFTAKLVGETVDNLVNRRCGEALQCVHAFDTPEGCGFGPSCKKCALRLTILNTIETGLNHREKEIKMSFFDGKNERNATFLISTKKLLIREQPLALVGMQNITERKKSEKELQESENRYRTLFESSRDAIMLINQERRILQGNPAAIQMFGCIDNEEFTSLNVRDISPEYQPDGTLSSVKAEQMVKIAMGKNSHFFEWKHKRKDGKEFFSTVLLTKMELGNEIIFQATVRDITENKLTEESLKQFKTITDKQIIGNAIGDAQGNLTYCNHAFAAMHGYKTNELIGKHLSIFYSEEEIKKMYHANNKNKLQVKKDGIYNKEVWRIRKDGSSFPSLTNVIELENAWRRPLFFAASVIDISQRKKAEEALKKREKELGIKTNNLEKANNALEVLLKKREEDKKKLEEGVLFNMRRVVEPYLEKLKDSNLDEKQMLYLNILEKNLNDILSAFPQTLSSNQIKLTPAELEVANLVKQGRSTKQIALALNISYRTAEVHRKNIRKKFNLKDKKINLRTHLLSSISN